MKKRYFLTGVLACLMTAGALTGCGEKFDYTIKLWCADEVEELFRTQANAYVKEAFADKKIKVQVSPVGESTAAGNMIDDVTAGADIFCFAQDQIARLKSAGALQEITVAADKQALIDANDETSIGAATVGGQLCAYPLTSDNGYFMYYDKSVITNPADLADMDTLVNTCKAAGKKIYMELQTSAWYMMSYFYAFGCQSEWTTNDQGLFVDYQDTLNSSDGVKACKAMYKILTETTVHVSSSDANEAFTSNAAVCVSGTWNYSKAKALLGDNLGAAALPSVSDGVTTAHLGSYIGCKLLGVKPQEGNVEKLAICQKLAQYLSGKKCQLERFESNGWGPSNKEAAATDAVLANPALQAIAAQMPYAHMQGQYPGDWWNGAKAIAASLKDSNGSDAQIKAILRTYEGTIDSYING